MQNYKNDRLNSFTIAHYILMFVVVVLCMGIVAWVLVGGRQSVAGGDIASNAVVRINESVDPCITAVRNRISQMWAYNPELIPGQYMNIAQEYATSRVESRVYGKCNNVSFVCRAGQIRYDCDPCALLSGMQVARERHIDDVVKTNCDKSMPDKMQD